MPAIDPYRIEWRPGYNSKWIFIETTDEHPGELKDYVKKHKWKWEGHYRVITQHVIQEYNATM